MDTTELLRVVGATVLPNLGGIVMGFLNKKSIKEWYDKLNLPKHRPPNWVFGPVWTSLYCCMGYASYLVWKTGGGFDGAARGPLILYACKLGLNWAWSPVFFGSRSVKWGFYMILPLTSAVYATGFAFYQVNRTAGYLFIPYAAWCTFASYLSYQIYKMNPQEYQKSLK